MVPSHHSPIRRFADRREIDPSERQLGREMHTPRAPTAATGAPGWIAQDVRGEILVDGDDDVRISTSDLPRAAKDLVQLNPDVIVATASANALAAKMATSTIPIVVPALGNPVALGLIEIYAHPGGNLTGIMPYVSGLPAKQLELARDRARCAENRNHERSDRCESHGLVGRDQRNRRKA